MRLKYRKEVLKMKKILTLTEEQFINLKKSKGQVKMVKELLNLPTNAKIGIGDTAVKINNSNPLEVYKENWKGEDYFYIVIEPMDEELAMCYSIYPKL